MRALELWRILGRNSRSWTFCTKHYFKTYFHNFPAGTPTPPTGSNKARMYQKYIDIVYQDTKAIRITKQLYGFYYPLYNKYRSRIRKCLKTFLERWAVLLLGKLCDVYIVQLRVISSIRIHRSFLILLLYYSNANCKSALTCLKFLLREKVKSNLTTIYKFRNSLLNYFSLAFINVTNFNLKYATRLFIILLLCILRCPDSPELHQIKLMSNIAGADQLLQHIENYLTRESYDLVKFVG